MKKAVVSLAVGDRCLGPWRQYLSRNWRSWCSRNGYDLIVFDKPLDNGHLASTRSLAWQKLLAMSCPELLAYDAVFWLDADVLIASDAPDPLESVDLNLISMVRDVGSPLAYEPVWFKQAWSRILAQSLMKNYSSCFSSSFFVRPDNFSYYQLWGLNPLNRPLYNTGFIAFSPKLFSSLFRDIYYRWHDGGPGSLHEMIPVNLELLQLKIIHELPSTFNQLAGVHHAVWSYFPSEVQSLHSIDPAITITSNSLFQNMLTSSHFLHFAGSHQLMLSFFEYCSATPSLANEYLFGRGEF